MEIHYFRNYVSENLEEFSMIFGHPLSYHGGHNGSAAFAHSRDGDSVHLKM